MVTDSEIVVTSDRAWFGDPRLGSYVVYVDGSRVGVLRPRGRVSSSVAAGSHRVRVRQWYYLSPTLDVAVGEHETVVLQADMRDRQRSVFRRMAAFMFQPWRSLVLRVVRTNGDVGDS